MGWSVTADVQRFDEAIDWFGKRTVMTRGEARRLDDARKAQAFWVGGGLHLDQVQRVFGHITKAIESGESFEDFRKRVRSELANPAHTETVFRNWTQRAYNAGRWYQMRDPEVLRFRPFGLVDAIIDGRETEYCRSVDGTLLALDDPWWETHWFPAHHRCRTSVRNISRREAERRGLKPPPADTNPADGWGQAPKTPEKPWKPDPAKYDPPLVAQLNKKAETGTVTRKKRRPKEHTAKHWRKHYENQYGDAAKSLGHGKASLERGLDTTVADVRARLKPIDAPGVRLMLEALEDADAARTLRESAGETDPMRKIAAALAGHLETITPRTTPWEHADLASGIGKRSAVFYSAVTDAKTQLPGSDWTFTTTRGRSSENAVTKAITYSSDPGALEHELGHSIESLNDKLFGRALLFLRARTVGEKLKKYGQNGECWDDQWLHYYTGRNYQKKNGDVFGTEITSTAIEVLFAGVTHWGTLQGMAQKDLEHLLFLLGQLAGE